MPHNKSNDIRNYDKKRKRSAEISVEDTYEIKNVLLQSDYTDQGGYMLSFKLSIKESMKSLLIGNFDPENPQKFQVTITLRFAELHDQIITVTALNCIGIYSFSNWSAQLLKTIYGELNTQKQFIMSHWNLETTNLKNKKYSRMEMANIIANLLCYNHRKAIKNTDENVRFFNTHEICDLIGSYSKFSDKTEQVNLMKMEFSGFDYKLFEIIFSYSNETRGYRQAFNNGIIHALKEKAAHSIMDYFKNEITKANDASSLNGISFALIGLDSDEKDSLVCHIAKCEGGVWTYRKGLISKIIKE